MATQVQVRTGGKSVGSAVLGILLTLAIFVLVFVGFLLAPLALLLVAFLVWTVLRPRQESEQAVAAEGEAHTADGTSRGGQLPHCNTACIVGAQCLTWY